ncbi:MAG: hypothetical protein ACK5CY_05395 [Bacteroidia bacterium]
MLLLGELSAQLVQNTTLIDFESGTHKLTEETSSQIIQFSKELYRSKKVELCIKPKYFKENTPIYEKRIRSIKKILIREGVADSLITIKAANDFEFYAVAKNNRDAFGYLNIYSKPYYKLNRKSDINNSSVISRDTTIYLGNDIPIQLKLGDYLLADTMPDVTIIDKLNEVKNNAISEYRIMNDYEVKCNQVGQFSFLVPLTKGVQEKQMVIYRLDATGKKWHEHKHLGKQAYGKAEALLIPISKSGIYRVGYIPKIKEQSIVLRMPKEYGIYDATLIRLTDSLNIPMHKVLGGRALAFEVREELSNYALNLNLIDQNGVKIPSINLILETCLNNKKTDESLSKNESLKKIEGFKIPEYFYKLDSEFINNTLTKK